MSFESFPVHLPVTAKLFWKEATQATKEKLAFLCFIILPLGFGYEAVVFLTLVSLSLFLPSVDTRVAQVLVHDQSKLCGLLRENGRYEDALKCSHGNGFENIVSLKSLARSIASQGDITEAVKLFQKATDMIPGLLESRNLDNGSNSIDKNEKKVELAEIYNEYASLLASVNEHDNNKVAALYDKAIRIGRDSVGVDDPRVCVWLVSLGIFKQQEMGDFASSMSLFQEVVEIRKRTLGPTDPIVAEWQIQMAYLLLSRPDAAQIGSKIIDLAQEALEIRIKNFGKDSPIVASTYNDLGTIAMLTASEGNEEQKYAQARLEYGQACIATYERSLGMEHPTTLKARQEWG